MRKRKSGQPAGTDLDWFVIPIEKIRQWALVIVLVLIAAGVGYYVYRRNRSSPEERAKAEIATAQSLLDSHNGQVRAAVNTALKKAAD